MRLFTTFTRVTWAAWANSASVFALSPISQSNTWLRATSGQTSAAPGSVAWARLGDGGQHVEVDLDRLGGVARGLQRVGNDEGDRIADMAHGAVGQHRMRRGRHVRAVAVVQRHRTGQRADAVGLQLRRGIDRAHPRHRRRRGGIHPPHPRRRVRTAQDVSVQHARQLDVVGVAPAPEQQPRVLHAANGLGNAELCHATASGMARDSRPGLTGDGFGPEPPV